MLALIGGELHGLLVPLCYNAVNTPNPFIWCVGHLKPMNLLKFMDQVFGLLEILAI